MKHTRRLVLFRRLGPLELHIAHLLRLARFEVRFLEPIGAVRNEEAVDQLQSKGIVWLKANEIAGIDVFAPIAASHQLTLKVIDRFFPLSVLTVLGNLMPAPANDPSKLRILLYELVRGYLAPHGLAIAVGELLSGQGYRVWLWQQEAAMLSLARPGFRNLHPSVLSAIVKAVGKFIGRLRLASRAGSAAGVVDGTPAATLTSASAAAAEVLYFPHQGPFFGDLFVKDQYYADNPASPLHQSRMCHVELVQEMTRETRATVERDYIRAGIAVHWLASYGRIVIAPFTFAKLAVRIGPVAAMFGLMLRQRLEVVMSGLSAFPQAKLALLGYESLFPRAVAAALQARGVVVAAAQERFVQPFHPGFHLILDYYLMQGELPAGAVRASAICQVGDVIVTGDLRLPNAVPERRGGPHRCLVLDYHSVNSPFADAFAIANGWASNLIFLEDILRLSEDFPEVEFTIRGKDTGWLALPAFKDIVARVGMRANLVVDRDRTFDRSATLLAHSDSVVARHTSLGDQALAMGMPVLFHERMKTGERSISAILDYSPYPVLTRSYTELRNKFSTILREGHFLNAAQKESLQRDFYAQPADLHPRQKAATLLTAILANIQNTSRRPAVGVGR